jgi:hypothetical protein
VLESVIQNETPLCVPKSIFLNDLSACACARVLKSYNLVVCGGAQAQEAWLDPADKLISCNHLQPHEISKALRAAGLQSAGSSQVTFD